jgi:hypothetical protein
MLHRQLSLKISSFHPLDALARPNMERHSAGLRFHHLQVVLHELLHLGHVHVARRRLADTNRTISRLADKNCTIIIFPTCRLEDKICTRIFILLGADQTCTTSFTSG